MYDPSPLIDKSKFAAIALYTDNILSATPQSMSKEEQKTHDTFTCRDSQTSRTDFKGMDFLQNGTILTYLQTT